LFLIYVNDIGNSVPGVSLKLFRWYLFFVFCDNIDDLQIVASDKTKWINSSSSTTSSCIAGWLVGFAHEM